MIKVTSTALKNGFRDSFFFRKGKNSFSFFQMGGRYLCFFLLMFGGEAAAKELDAYAVQFSGPLNEQLIERLESHSRLAALQNYPPATFAGLERRAESDLTNLVQVMHSFAYYNAQIDLAYTFEEKAALVIVKIDPGAVYPFEKLLVNGEESAAAQKYQGMAALPETMIKIEKELLKMLECQGYPFAQIVKSELIADQTSKSATFSVTLESGPQALFGPVAIKGSESVKECYFTDRIAWCEGDLYSPSRISATSRALERGQLFSTVTIGYPETPPADGVLPMTIEVRERKQRSIGAGINYASQRGPGCSGEWQHRNFNGMGELLTFHTNLWHDEQFAKLSYLQPDLFGEKRNLEWLAELYREKTEGYTTRSLSLSAIASRPWNCYGYLSLGPKYMYLHDTDIHEEVHHEAQKHGHERFHLLKAPFTFRWDCTDNLLDPTRGYRIKAHVEPSYQMLDSQFAYVINTMTLSRYWKLSHNPDLVFAGATTLGSIVGPKKTTIPRSELFDAGTDTLLRGYRYKSVSPLDSDYDPTGGRSMLISSLELRWKMTKEIGWVAFYDFGNVYSSILPDPSEKLLQSAGIGFRYYTPIGPIRLDLAFPLTPRKHVDKSCYQAYLSIGQTF